MIVLNHWSHLLKETQYWYTTKGNIKVDDRKDITTKRTSELFSKSRFKDMVLLHLLKSNVIPEGNAEVVHDHKRYTRSADFFMPIDNDREPNVEPTVTSAVPRQSARIRQPPKRLIEEMNN